MPPKYTEDVNPLPVMVTLVPPTDGPEEGDTEVIPGDSQLAEGCKVLAVGFV